MICFVLFCSPTFYRIWKKKSTEGFSSVPYVVSLFSAMLWIYYATLKSNVSLLITINAFGCFIETIYIAIFLTYGNKQARVRTYLFSFPFYPSLFISIPKLPFITARSTEASSPDELGWIRWNPRTHTLLSQRKQQS